MLYAIFRKRKQGHIMKNIKSSKPFIDDFALSIHFPPEHLPKQIEKKRLLISLFDEWVKPYTDEMNKEIENKRSLHKLLHTYRHLKGAIHIGKYQNYTLQVHFKGRFFVNSTNYKTDFDLLTVYVNKIQMFLNDQLNKYFGMGKKPKYELKVARIDLAINFYGAQIWNPDSQTFCHGTVRKKNYWYDKSKITGIYLGDKNTTHIVFKSYDKRFDKKEPLEIAKMRFGTDQFCRNEWSIRFRSLQKFELRNWIDWQKLISNKYYNPQIITDKNKSTFNQLLLHLRKNRDVTYFSKNSHPYNIIHLETGFKAFKGKALFNKPKGKAWPAYKNIDGIINNHNLNKLEVMQLITTLGKKYDMIPPKSFQDLHHFWMKEGLEKESFSFLNRAMEEMPDKSGKIYS